MQRGAWVPACLSVCGRVGCVFFQVSTDIIHFLSKKLHYYKGDYDTFVNVRTELAKNQRRAYEASAAKKQHMQEFIDKFRSNAKRASLVQSRIKVRLFVYSFVCLFWITCLFLLQQWFPLSLFVSLWIALSAAPWLLRGPRPPVFCPRFSRNIGRFSYDSRYRTRKDFRVF